MMKSRSEIWSALLEETGRACSVSTSRDLQTVATRVAAEGESFFTMTLPAFHRDLITALALGEIPSDAFPGFARRRVSIPVKGAKGVPEFLGGFLDLLFCSERGVLTDGEVIRHFYTQPVLRPFDVSDIEHINMASLALKSLRQLTLTFSKEKDLCDDQKIDEAVQQYISTDKELDAPLWIREVIAFSKAGSSRTLGEHYVLVLDDLFQRLTVRSSVES